MKVKNSFNFQKEITRLLPFIRKQYSLNSTNEDLSSNVQKMVKVSMVSLRQDEEIQHDRKSSCMAFAETENSLIYVFALTNPLYSNLTLTMIKKGNTKMIQRSLKRLGVQVTSMKLTFNSSSNLILIMGSSCGRIFSYFDFEVNQIKLRCSKISSSKITDLLVPSFDDCIFVLSSNHIVYLYNYKRQQIVRQYQFSLPLIEDNKSKMIMDLGQTFLGQVFSYGRIILWQIEAVDKYCAASSCETQTQASVVNVDAQGLQTGKQSFDSGQYKKKTTKKIIIKSKMSITSCVVEGIDWIDFIGLFLIVITQQGMLKIIAVNVNEFNQNQQLYTVIEQFQICHTSKDNKTVQSQFISSVAKINEHEGILVAKVVDKKVNGKWSLMGNYCIQKYVFDQDYKVQKIVKIKVNDSVIIRELSLSRYSQYLLVRKDEYFTLIKKDGLFQT